MSMLGRIWSLFQAARENSHALDKAKQAYEDGATLREILDTFARETGHPIDDKAAEALLAAIGQATNVLFNVADLLEGLAFEIEAVEHVFTDMKDKPLREVLGDS